MMSLYATLFSTGMKYKWRRVYVDLFAGAGFSQIRGTNDIVAASPILALQVTDSFDKYIFCELSVEKMTALKTRAQRLASAADTAFILGDCNEHIEEILCEIPSGSSHSGVLTLCVADPYNIGAVHFDTIAKLAAHRVDIFILLAVYMDANRNYDRYTSEDAPVLDKFLGYTGWRESWRRAHRRKEFPVFLAQEFSKRMETLGYLPQPVYNMKKVRTDDKNLPLYFLALFSRSEKAYEFWQKVRKYSTEQIEMF
jgi:three-Cys-motif partner protein